MALGPISEDHLKDVCKFGQKGETCAFLMMAGPDFQCAKFTSIEPQIRARLAQGTMNATGENCTGWLLQ